MMRGLESARGFSTVALSIALVGALGGRAAGQATPPPGERGVLAARAPGQLRVMTWNINTNSIFPAAGSAPDSLGQGRPGQFARVLRAVRPDVLCLQEVTREMPDVAALMATILPPGSGHAWDVHAVFDTAIVSRFELKERAGRVFGQGRLRRGHAVALVDLPDQDYARDLYVICAHFQSQPDPAQMALRQRQADAIAAWIRDARSPGGEITLAPQTPLAVMGDLNVIDSPSPSLATLLTGNIVDEQTYGADFRPDWDGSDLADALPSHNDAGPDRYTWRDDTQRFMPGMLDRILYSDSAMTLVRSFVLDTMAMSDDDRRRVDLRRTDVMFDAQKGIHDHLPVVADFALAPAVPPAGRSTP
jgi:endonuclease/exonuclease/phosphatase family metal-dependent hydrolase